jgi:hypothetical protein
MIEKFRKIEKTICWSLKSCEQPIAINPKKDVDTFVMKLNSDLNLGHLLPFITSLKRCTIKLGYYELIGTAMICYNHEHFMQ